MCWWSDVSDLSIVVLGITHAISLSGLFQYMVRQSTEVENIVSLTKSNSFISILLLSLCRSLIFIRTILCILCTDGFCRACDWL